MPLYNLQKYNSPQNQKKNIERKRLTKYSTKIINELLSDLHKGFDIDMTPFYQGDTNFRNPNLPFELTEEEKNEYIKCSVDAVYFIEKYITFQTDKGYTNVKLFDYQKDFIHILCDENWSDKVEEFVPIYRYCVGMMSRQSSKTTTVCAAFVWYMTFHNERNLFIVANKDSTTVEIVSKLENMVKNLPFWLKPGIMKKNDHSIKFDNGCYLHSAATSKTPSTGYTIHLMLLDEAALIPNNIIDDFWKSVYPTLSSSEVSKIILISTPRGRQNLFYRIWEKAEFYDSYTGEVNEFKNGFVKYRVDWWQHPKHDEEWARQERIRFGETEFAQEYELQWDVAASKVVRGTDMQFINRIKKEYINLDIPTIPQDMCNRFYWSPDFDPTNTNVFKEKFLFVIDTAEGKEETVQGKKSPDYNVINIFKMELMSPSKVKKFALDKKIEMKDIFRFRQVGVYMDNNHDEEEMAKAAKYLVYGTMRCGRFGIDNVRILLEMNFNGKNFVKNFQNSDYWYDDLILKTYHTKPVPGEKQKKKFGYKTTTGGNGIGKSYFCEEGAKMITKRQIIVNHFSKVENECTISELGAFDKIKKSNLSKFYTYEGVGLHDDLAKTVLDCSRAIEIPEFLVWLEEYFEESNELKASWKYRQLQEILKVAVETDEGNLSNEEFTTLYTDGGGSQYNNITQSNNGYAQIKPTFGSLMRHNNTGNPYIGRNVQNPYTGRGNRPNPYTGFGSFNKPEGF